MTKRERKYPRPEREWLLRAYCCWRKLPRTKVEAARFVELERHKSPGDLAAFACPYGDHWHVGRKGADDPVLLWRNAKLWWRQNATEDCSCGSGLTMEDCALGPDVRPVAK